jgi:hypothetical protein
MKVTPRTEEGAVVTMTAVEFDEGEQIEVLKEMGFWVEDMLSRINGNEEALPSIRAIPELSFAQCMAIMANMREYSVDGGADLDVAIETVMDRQRGKK